jgi:thiol-disulfide isomerase/thioredoxin
MQELIADLSVEEMSAAQIAKVANMLPADPAKMEAAKTRLEILSDDKGADGANAAVMYAAILMRSQDQGFNDALARALAHPGLAEAVKTPNGSQIFSIAGRVDAEGRPELVEQVLSLRDLLTDDLPPASLTGTMAYYDSLERLGGKADAATRNAVRERLIALYSKATDSLKGSTDKADQALADRLTHNAKFLNGAFARGELIDHTAPALGFQWSDGDKPIKSLADFNGKVVVLDFWATWCGPCIASFPKVKELQTRYDGYDVVIIGVTSLQGKHYPGGGADPIDTEGNPQKEYELMSAFMKDKDMTWRVAFTEEDVFNPDYGVNGIPHVAIIDPEGKVRYNGLHPAVPLKEKADKIDALLKAAGLATPAPVEEEKQQNQPAADK